MSGWVQACVWAADEADFVLVLHSANYDEGHYAIAERLLVKESNVPHMVFELDAPAHPEYAAAPADALRLLQSGVVLSQQDRVETNTAPCTLAGGALAKEDRDAYAKITKVWSPKHGSHEAMKIDLDRLADEQLAASEALAKQRVAEAAAEAAGAAAGGPAQAAATAVDVTDGEDKELAELQRMIASGPVSKRGR